MYIFRKDLTRFFLQSFRKTILIFEEAAGMSYDSCTEEFNWFGVINENIDSSEDVDVQDETEELYFDPVQELLEEAV